MRYFLQLAYKGTNYHGWQIQENAISVQQIIQEKLKLILKEAVEITGSGRTDTGVHAAQQFAHFDYQGFFDAHTVFRVNCMLPKDVSILEFYPVKAEAHARFDAVFREYEYRISLKKNPFLENLCLQFTKQLDVEAMNRASEQLLLHKDFQSFSKVHTDVANFLCDISNAEWVLEGDMLIFKIRANRFLRGMVRAIVGSLLEVGLKKINSDDFNNIILSKNRQNAGAAAPPYGLFLTKIHYPEEIFLN